MSQHFKLKSVFYKLEEDTQVSYYCLLSFIKEESTTLICYNYPTTTTKINTTRRIGYSHIFKIH